MKKTETNKLDKLARKWALDNYGGKCIVCGETKKLNVHHIITRRSRSCRWFKENLCPLCPKHHTLGIQSAHKNPLWYRKFLIDLWGEDWEKKLWKQSNKVFKGTFETVKKYLEGEIDNYI